MQLEGKQQDFCTESNGEGEVPVGVAALSLLRKLQEKGEHRNFSTETDTALPPRMCPKTRALALKWCVEESISVN